MSHEFEEIVTHALVRDITLPGDAGTLALITIDNGLDHTKPTTLGPQSMKEIKAAVEEVHARAARGEIVAAAVTGKPYYLAAGADLKAVATIATDEQARDLGHTGHEAYRLLGEMAVPTFAFINGAALGGGLEIALNCTYRTIASDVGGIALPETALGLVPGWGGAYILPRLIGIAAALDVMIARPAANKPVKAAEAAGLGIADILLEPADFLEQSLVWAAGVLNGSVTVDRREIESPEVWNATVRAARAQVDATVHGARPAPYKLLELLELGPDTSRDEGFAAEDRALEELIMSEEFRASIYAFHSVNAAKRPTGAPDPKLAQPITRVGIVGAGLMAAQLAFLFSQRLGVPVVMRDLDQERVDKGLQFVASTAEKLVAGGKLKAAVADKVVAGVHGTTELGEFAQCDFIIEAVTEILPLKKKVFAELEQVISPTAILATNTSALSVTEMAADLQHPQRVVGLHFFNPVAQMPLIEVIHAEKTTDEALATAFAVAKKLRKTAVLAGDRPGFVVNRLLILLMGKIVEAIENGTDISVADRALRPLGLPMGPFALFDLVGPAVGLHVLTSLRQDLGERFPASPGLEQVVAEGARVSLPPVAKGLPAEVDPAAARFFGKETHESQRESLTEDEVLDRVLTALTAEIGMMLEEGVVQTPTQIDVCMILGAGWSFAAGGITPYLDRTGYSEKILGKRFHPQGIASVPAHV
ncbi:3-hydroxyacyl-CoA dehydrogenase NAD-binding domain-containing protein [Timonella senegalensis]|uniref:3-hydroxyacyl-CoA dehydrogenase NAD-binding domain-containing protein n=1 Tax=Timonella senegalensis TaxID=1465825 RepID=UPI0028B22DB2|nr:3-hydroxyacyl-CoA dehydrogenase NAD-binding domain-containing protein [Timonella senegalensis]